MKRCPKCGENKPLDDFYRSAKAKSGRQSYCKPCLRRRADEWAERNPEKRKAIGRNFRRRHSRELAQRRQKERAADPEKFAVRYQKWAAQNQTRRNELTKESRKRYPEKVKARQAVADAVYEGRLSKPSHCGECGVHVAKAKLHGHHEDYSKPLEVRWLCRVCHNAVHRQETAHAA